MDTRSSEFYKWMCLHAQLMGWDLDETEDVQGGTASRRNVLLVWASIALTGGLTPEQTAQIARGLGVTPEEVTAAYQPEMRQAAVDEILDHPDLKQLNGLE